MRPLAPVFAIALAVTAAGGCKKKVEKKAGPVAERAPSGELEPVRDRAVPVLAPPSADPKVLASELDALVAAGDKRGEQAMAASLRLPDPAAWFATTFGAERGAALADEYGNSAAILDGLARSIRFNQNAHKRHKRVVEKFESASDPAATGLQARALAAMKRPVALYSVRYSAIKGAGVMHIYNFIHDGGRFRYVGPLHEVAGQPPTGAELARLQRRGRELGNHENQR